jgi:hypothetical protein
MKGRGSSALEVYQVVVKAGRRPVAIIGRRLAKEFADAMACGFNEAEAANPKGLQAVVTRLSPKSRQRLQNLVRSA